MTSWQFSKASRWAAPVVVTVALSPGCQSNAPPKSGCEPPECHMNPPGVEPTAEPTVEPTVVPTASTTGVPPTEPTSSSTTAATPEPPEDGLPEAPAGAPITRQGELCFYRPVARCPEGEPGVPRPTCNPPGPRRVKCPPE